MPESVIQIVLIAGLAIVVFTLVYSTRYMIKDGEPDPRFMKTLGLRVLLAFAVVGFIALCGAMGWIGTPPAS